MLILSRYIAKHELRSLRQYFSIEDLIDGAKKVIKGLGQQISPYKNHKSFSFFKVRIGSSVKGRMIVFVVSNKKVVPLLIRLKKDKKMGMNMSANNPDIVAQIDKNLTQVISDIESGDFEEFHF